MANKRSRRSPSQKRRRVPSYSFGLVLTGGAAFGAWEVGALRALWKVWHEKYPDQPPPIRVVAGTSTGALIAPFALLEAKDLDHVTHWYTNVSDDQISAPSPAVLLTAALFLKWGVSIASFGDPKSHRSPLEQDIVKTIETEDTGAFQKKDLLFQCFWNSLQEKDPHTGKEWQTLERCAKAWNDGKRLVACAIDFERGEPDTANNSWPDLDENDISTESRLFRAIFASCVPPLMGPPVPLRRGKREPPHFDGGICSEAPFDALFDTARRAPAIPLSHVILLSAYPRFPGRDTDPFPKKPKFQDIGLRFDSLLSEVNVTRDTRIARSALRLRSEGVQEPEVQKMTGLKIPDPVPKLIEVFPEERLGWNNSNYDCQKMNAWIEDGRRVAAKIFRKELR